MAFEISAAGGLSLSQSGYRLNGSLPGIYECRLFFQASAKGFFNTWRETRRCVRASIIALVDLVAAFWKQSLGGKICPTLLAITPGDDIPAAKPGPNLRRPFDARFTAQETNPLVICQAHQPDWPRIAFRETIPAVVIL